MLLLALRENRQKKWVYRTISIPASNRMESTSLRLLRHESRKKVVPRIIQCILSSFFAAPKLSALTKLRSKHTAEATFVYPSRKAIGCRCTKEQKKKTPTLIQQKSVLFCAIAELVDIEEQQEVECCGLEKIFWWWWAKRGSGLPSLYQIRWRCKVPSVSPDLFADGSLFSLIIAILTVQIMAVPGLLIFHVQSRLSNRADIAQVQDWRWMIRPYSRGCESR